MNTNKNAKYDVVIKDHWIPIIARQNLKLIMVEVKGDLVRKQTTNQLYFKISEEYISLLKSSLITYHGWNFLLTPYIPYFDKEHFPNLCLQQKQPNLFPI